MYFPRTAEYALRAMAHLARLPEGEAARAQELSEAADIPTPYLSKILRKLVLAGLLRSKKGHGGGFVLARPARVIRFLDVLAAADYETNPGDCAFGWGTCDPNHPCPLHPSWAQLRETFLEWAATTTLAEVRDAPYLPRELARVTGLPEGAADPGASKPRRSLEPVTRGIAKPQKTAGKTKAAAKAKPAAKVAKPRRKAARS